MRNLFILFLLVCSFNAFAKGEYVDITDVQLTIVKNGVELDKVSVSLLQDKEAVLTIHSEDKKLPARRVTIESSRDLHEGREIVDLKINYATHDGNKWTEEVDSKLVAYPNSEASVTVEDEKRTIEIHAEISTRDHEILKTDPRVIDG